METKYKLLMVDDDQHILQVVSEELSDRGYAVDTIADPTTVLAYLNTHSVDLLLLDLKMPGVDGISLLKQVEQESPDLPVIILTGHGDIDSASEVMRYGAVGYIQKPTKMEQLQQTIDEAIKKYGTAVERMQYLQSRKLHPILLDHSYTSNSGNLIPKDDHEMVKLLRELLCNYSESEQEGRGWLPLMNIDEYSKQVILQYQSSFTETELSRRLGFSRDKLWRVRKRLGIPRK